MLKRKKQRTEQAFLLGLGLVGRFFRLSSSAKPQDPLWESLPQLISLRLTANLLKVHPNTLRLWDRVGQLRAVRLGSRQDRRYNRDDVRQLWLERTHTADQDFVSQWMKRRERLNIFRRRWLRPVGVTAAIVAVMIAISSSQFVAADTSSSTLFNFQPQDCSGWQQSDLAVTVNVPDGAPVGSFTQKNSAVYQTSFDRVLGSAADNLTTASFDTPSSVFSCSGFSLGNVQTATITEPQLIISFVSLTSGNSTGGFIVETSIDGRTWKTLTILPVQTMTSGRQTLPLDKDISTESLERMKVRIRPDIGIDAPVVQALLDGISLQGTVVRPLSENPQKNSQAKRALDSLVAFSESTYKSAQHPVVTVPKKETKKALFFTYREVTWTLSRVALRDQANIETDAVYSGADTINGDNIDTALTIDTHNLHPGKYTVKITMHNSDGQEATIEKEFLWGVVALNFDRPNPRPGEEVHGEIGVLDDAGVTICDAIIQVKLTDPRGRTTNYTEKRKNLNHSGICIDKGVTNQADYSFRFTPERAGVYHISLTAKTAVGERRVEDNLVVEEISKFDVQRSDFSSRIYPPAPYTETIVVTPTKDYRGVLTERVPSDFVVTNLAPEGNVIPAANAGESQLVQWPVDWIGGQTYYLRYTYDAPYVSPAIFLLGPITIETNSLSDTDWTESRPWQIASDAVTPVGDEDFVVAQDDVISPLQSAYKSNDFIDVKVYKKGYSFKSEKIKKNAGAPVTTVTDVKVIDPTGAKGSVDVTNKKLSKDNRDLEVIHLTPGRSFKPGQFTIKISLTDGTTESVEERTFLWGVLAMNLRRSIERPKTDTYIGLGVLNAKGTTMCDAQVILTVTDPTGQVTTRKTDDGSITKNPECVDKSVTNDFDYAAPYTTDIAGVYTMHMIADYGDGPKSIDDTFEVRDSVDFDIERGTFSMRVYPIADYPSQISITSTADYQGPISEVVPASFGLTEISDSGVAVTTGPDQVITWNVDWKAGEKHTLGYTINFPDVSPEFFLLGPLIIGDRAVEGSVRFQEARQWQIASDSVGSGAPTRLWTMGFENNTITAGIEITTTAGTVAIDTGTVRTGTYSLRANPSAAAANALYFFNAASDSAVGTYARTYVRFATLPNSNTQVLTFRDNAATNQLSIRYDNTNAHFELWNEEDSAQIGSDSTGTITTGVWYRLELYADFGTAATGDTKATARLDGSEFATSTTQNWANGIRTVAVGPITTTTTQDGFFDDIAVNADSTTSVIGEGYPGEGKVVYLRPNGNGTNVAWPTCVGTGCVADYTSVDEVTPNDLTDYNSCSVSAQLEDYLLTNATSNGLNVNDTVKVITTNVRQTSTASALSRTFNAQLGLSGTFDTAQNIASTVQTTWFTNAAATPQNPATTVAATGRVSQGQVSYDKPGTTTDPWTPTDLDSAQVQISSSDCSPVESITAIWVMVEYVAAEGGRMYSTGFELQSATTGVEYETNVGSPTISTSTFRSGAAALRANPSAATGGFSQAFRTADDNQATFFRAYVRFATFPNANTLIMAIQDNAATNQASLRFDNTNSVFELWNEEDTAQIGSDSVGTLNLNQWYRIEMKVDFGTAATGDTTVEAYLDGTQIATSAVQNWANGIKTLAVGIITTNATADVFIDDVAINQNAGTTQNSYPGSGRVVHMRPDAAGDNAQFAVNVANCAALNYTCVDEITPNDATGDVVGSTTLNQVDDFNLDSTATAGIPSTATIKLAQVGIRFNNSAATLSGLKLRIKDAASAHPIESYYIDNTTNGTYFTNNETAPRLPMLTAYTRPNITTAWTTTELDAAQIGFRLGNDGGTNNFGVATEWLLVEYNDDFSIGGNVYTNETPSALDCSTGGNRTVRVKVNGSGNYTNDCTASSGAFSVTGVTAEAAGDVITVFLDGETEDAVLITRAVNKNTAIASLPLTQNRVWVRHEDAGPITNSDLGKYDSDNDADIGFSSNSGTLTTASGFELHVPAGETFTPGGVITTNATGGDFHVLGTSTIDTATTTIGSDITIPSGGTLNINANTTVSGGDITVTSTGALTTTAGTPTVTVTATGTVGGTGNITIYNLTTSGTGTTTFNGSGTNTINNNISVGAGTTLKINATTGITGTITNTTTGIITTDSGTPTVTITGTGSMCGGNSGNCSFYSLTFGGASTTFGSDFTILKDLTLPATVTAGSTTVTMTGTTSAIVGGGATINSLILNGTNSTTTLNTSDLTVSGTVTIGGDANANTDVLSISSGRTVSATGTTTITDASDTISGAGTLRFTDTSTGPGTTGTLSSIVRYDATAANIANTTFDARTYGGAVELYSNSGTGKSVSTVGSGTYVFSSTLNITTAGAGATTLDMNTTDPTTFTVSGTLTNGTTSIIQATSAGTFNINGTYVNNGTFTHNTGTVTANGSAQQNWSGTLSGGTGKFNNLIITNSFGDGSSTFSVTFAGNAETAATFTATTASTKLRFNATSTYTFQDFTINGQASGTRVYLRSSTGASAWLLNVAGTATVSYTNVMDSNATGSALEIDAANGTNFDATGNTNWNFTAGISISGFIYTNDASTALDCSTGGNRTVAVKVNGTGTRTGTCSLSSGAFTITLVPIGSAGDVITVFISGASEKGVTVTLANDTVTNISALPLRVNRLTVSHKSAGPISNNATTGLGRFDKDDDATNFFFTANSDNLSVDAGKKLLVDTGKTFTPGGTVTTAAASTAGNVDGDVEVQSTAVLSMGTNALSVGGDFTNAGTLTLSGGQTTTMTATGAGFTITSGGQSLKGLTFNGASGGWTNSGALTVSENWTGTVGGFTQTNSTTITVNGTAFNLANNFTWTKATSGANLIFENGTNLDFTDSNASKQNLGVVQIGASPGVTTLKTDMSATTVTIPTTDTFKTKGWEVTTTGAFDCQGSCALDLTDTAPNNEGDGTILDVGGDFTMSASATFTAYTNSKVFVNSTSGTDTNRTWTTGGKTYNEVELKNAGASNDQVTLSGNLDIDGTFTLTDGTIKADTNNPTTNTAGDVSIASTAVYTKGTGTWTFDGTAAKTYTDSTGTPQNIGAVAITKTHGTPSNNKVTLASSMTVNTMTVSASNTLDLASSGYILKIANVGATGTVLTVTGTLTPGSNSTVQFSATNSGGTVVVPATTYNNLKISGNETYDLGGNLTSGNAVSGGITIDTGGATLDAVSGSNFSISLAGDWTNNGVFTARTGTVTMTGTANLTGSTSTTFNNLTISGTTVTVPAGGSDVTVGALLTVDVSKALTIATGRTVTLSNTGASALSLSGTINGPGKLIYRSSDVFPTGGALAASLVLRYDMVTNNMTTAVRTDYYTIEAYNASGAGRTLTLGNGTHTLSGNLDLQSNAASSTLILAANTSNPAVNVTGNVSSSVATAAVTLSMGSNTWTVGGNFDLTNITTFNNNSGTLVMNGTGTLTSNSKTLFSVTLSGVITLASATHTINGNLSFAGGTITAGTSTILMNGTGGKTLTGGSASIYALTIDPTSAGTITLQTSSLTATNQLTVATGDTLSISSGITLTNTFSTNISLSGTISGAGTLRFTDTSGGAGTTGTLSSVVRYDATSANIVSTTIDARQYRGRVEFYSNSGSARTATFPTGTFSCLGSSSHYYIIADAGGDMTVNTSSNNPATISVCADLDFTGIGGGTEILSAGTGNINVQGNIVFTDGTYTSSGTLTMNSLSAPQTLTTAGQSLKNFTSSSADASFVNETITVTGNFSISSSVAFSPSTSTVVMTGTANTIDNAAWNLYNLTIDPSSAGTITVTSDVTVDNVLTVATGDTLSINSGMVVRSGLITSTFVLNGTMSGLGQYWYEGSAAFPTTGTISSELWFVSDADTDLIASARTYGGLVTIDHGSGSNWKTVFGTAGSQTLNFSAGIELGVDGTGNNTIDAATWNPTINVTGNVAARADSGSGIRTIQSGTGTWTVTGNVNLTGITYTAASGNTLAMSGTSKTLTSNSNALYNFEQTAGSSTMSGTTTLSNNLTITAGTVTAPSSGALNVAGDFSNAGTFTHNSSTVTMSGSSKNITGASATTFNNLTISGSVTLAAAGSDATVSTLLTVGSTKSLAVGTGRLLTLSRNNASNSLTITGGTVNGPGTLSYQNATANAFPTDGTLGSTLIVRFDTVNGDLNVPPRTDYGSVVAYKNSTTARSVFLGTTTGQTLTLAGNLDVSNGNATNSLTLDASTGPRNPTVNVTGNVTNSLATGSTIISMGSGTWNVGGNFDLSNVGTFNNNSGTLTMNGTGTLTTNSKTLNNFTTSGSGTITLANATHTLAGNLTIGSSNTITPGSSTINMTGPSKTIDGGGKTIAGLSINGNTTVQTNDLGVSGTLTIGNSTTLTITTVTLTDTGGDISWGTSSVISGTGLLIFTNASGGPGTSGTLSVPVRYDASAANITSSTFDARTYGGAVTLYANSGSAKSITALAGGYTFSSTLTTTAGGAGVVTADFSAATGTTTVTGALTIGATTSFTAPATLACGSDFTNSGTFTHSSGAVNFTTNNNTTFSGSTTFNNLTITDTTAKTVTFVHATTTTISGTWTVTGAAGQLVTLTRDNTSAWNVNPTSASVDYVDVNYSNNTGTSICATHSISTNGGNTGWSVSAGTSCGITVSGVIRQSSNETSPYDCSAVTAVTVGVSVNGGTSATADCTLNTGVYSITTATSPSLAGDPVVVYINNGETAIGTTVTLTVDTSSNITNLDIIDGRLALTYENGGPMTNAKLATGDNGNAGIRYAVASSNLTTESGIELHVLAGKTYTPGGTVTTNTTGGDLHVLGIATLDTASNDIGRDISVATGATLNVNATTLVRGGDITTAGTGIVATTSGTPTTTIRGTGTIGGGSGAITFYSLAIGDGTTATTALASDATVTNTLSTSTGSQLTINSAKTLSDTGAVDVSNSGTITGSTGTLRFTDTASGPGTGGTISSIVRFDATTANIASGTFDGRTYGGDLELYSNVAGVRTVTPANATYTITGNLKIITGASQSSSFTMAGATSNPVVNITGNLTYTKGGSSTPVITSGTSLWTVTGNVDFTNGTYTATSGNELKMNGTANLVGNSQTLYKLTIDGTNTTVTVITSGITVNNVLTVGGAADSNNDTLSISGGNTVFSGTAGTVTLVGSGTDTISGAGTLQIKNSNLEPTNGTISSIVTFDSTSGSITAPSRAFGGTVFIYNFSNTPHTVTLSAGALSITGDLVLNNNGDSVTGAVTLAAATSNPSVTVTGSVSGEDFSGLEAHVITMGSNTWTVSTNFDMTHITTLTAGTSTLLMNGTGTLTSNGKTLNNLQINSSGVVTLASATHTVAGNLLLGGSGIPVVTGSTISMTGSATTIDGGGKTLANLTIGNSSGTISLQNTDLTVSSLLTTNGGGGSLTLNSGRSLTLTADTGTSLTNSGTITGSGTLVYQNHTTTVTTSGTLSSAFTFDTLNGTMTIPNRTFGGLVTALNTTSSGRTVIFGSSVTPTLTGFDMKTTGTGTLLIDGATNNPTTVTVTGNLTASAANGAITLSMGSGNWSVSGNVDLTNVTTFNHNAGTVTMTGTGTLTSNSKTLNNFTTSGGGTITLANATHTLAGNLTIGSTGLTAGSSTIDMTGSSKTIAGGGKTLNILTISGNTTAQTSDLTVSGTLNIAAAKTLTITSVIVTDSGTSEVSWGDSASTITGTGTLSFTNSSTGGPGTGGILSSIVRFDATAANIPAAVVDARTYGGIVEPYSNSTSTRTVTLNSGTYITSGSSSHFNPNAVNTGDLNVDASTNNPTVTIGGDLDFTGTGNGTELLAAGTGTWTVTGNVDFTNGVYGPKISSLSATFSETANRRRDIDTFCGIITSYNCGGGGTYEFTDTSDCVGLGQAGTETIGRAANMFDPTGISDSATILSTHLAATIGTPTGTESTIGRGSTDAVNGLSCNTSAMWNTLGTSTYGSTTGWTSSGGKVHSLGTTGVADVQSRLTGTTARLTVLIRLGGIDATPATFTTPAKLHVGFIDGGTPTLVMNGTSKTLTSANNTLYNLSLPGTITLANATHTVANNLDLTSGTVTPGTSTVLMTGTSATLTGSGTGSLYSLTVDPPSAGTVTLAAGGGDLTVASNLSVASSDTLSIGAARTLTLSNTSGSSLTLNGTVSGSGRLTYQTVIGFPTTGTISSIVRFDATGASSQTISSRTYGGAVEIYNNSGGAKTVASGSGTMAFSSTLDLSVGSGSVVLDLNTTDPTTTTVTGAVTIGANATLSAPSTNAFNVNNNYTNDGTFTDNSGTVTLAGAAQQALSGTLTGSSDFNNVTVTNAFGDGSTTWSVTFAGNAAAAGTFTATTANTKLRFNSGSTYTFVNVTLNGQATNSRVFLRSSSTGTQWNLTSTGTQTVSNTDVRDSYACGGDTVDAIDGTNQDSTHNDCWNINTISLTISDTTIGFGVCAPAAPQYATGTSGSASDSADAHTISVASNARGGYSLTVGGSTLTSTVGTITAIGGSATASSAGSEQFGLRTIKNSGTGTVSSPFDTANWAFTAGSTQQVASYGGSSSSYSAGYGLRYICNVSAVTEAGSYSTDLTYILTSTF